MNRKDQRGEEKKILDAVTSIFPGFMKGIHFARVDRDPPDFIGKDQEGRDIGLELTCWLNQRQATDSRGREFMAEDLLSVLDWETRPRPKNLFSMVITPRWGKRIKPRDRQGLSREFHTAVRLVDGKWERLRARHWRPLPEGSGFDYEAHEGELKRFPTLIKYVSSIWFQERSSSQADHLRISVMAVGPDFGLYDPNVSIQSLREAIRKKIDRYSKGDAKNRLDRHRLDALYLLLYADPKRCHLNSPFQTCSQMRTSPTEGLLNAATLATEGLSELPRLLDGVYLYYSLWSSEWLALIWPKIRQFSAIDQQASR